MTFFYLLFPVFLIVFYYLDRADRPVDRYPHQTWARLSMTCMSLGSLFLVSPLVQSPYLLPHMIILLGGLLLFSINKQFAFNLTFTLSLIPLLTLALLLHLPTVLYYGLLLALHYLTLTYDKKGSFSFKGLQELDTSKRA